MEGGWRQGDLQAAQVEVAVDGEGGGQDSVQLVDTLLEVGASLLRLGCAGIAARRAVTSMVVMLYSPGAVRSGR